MVSDGLVSSYYIHTLSIDHQSNGHEQKELKKVIKNFFSSPFVNFTSHTKAHLKHRMSDNRNDNFSPTQNGWKSWMPWSAS